MNHETKEKIKKMFCSANMKILWLGLSALVTLAVFCFLASLPISPSFRFGLVLGCGMIVVLIYRIIYGKMTESDETTGRKEGEE